MLLAKSYPARKHDYFQSSSKKKKKSFFAARYCSYNIYLQGQSGSCKVAKPLTSLVINNILYSVAYKEYQIKHL